MCTCFTFQALTTFVSFIFFTVNPLFHSSIVLQSLGPCVRTALFSRLGPGARISSHRGWADLANHVLRCHLGLSVPPGEACAVWCDGEVTNDSNIDASSQQ